MLTFRLPRPLSQNGLYYNHRGGGRAASQAHRVWRMEAMQEISAQRALFPVKAILGPYRITIVVSRVPRSGKRADLGNLEKCVSDVLVKMGIVRDDSDAEEIILRWGTVAGCEVTLESVDNPAMTLDGTIKR